MRKHRHPYGIRRHLGDPHRRVVLARPDRIDEARVIRIRHERLEVGGEFGKVPGIARRVREVVKGVYFWRGGFYHQL